MELPGLPQAFKERRHPLNGLRPIFSRKRVPDIQHASFAIRETAHLHRVVLLPRSFCRIQTRCTGPATTTPAGAAFNRTGTIRAAFSSPSDILLTTAGTPTAAAYIFSRATSAVSPVVVNRSASPAIFAAAPASSANTAADRIAAASRTYD